MWRISASTDATSFGWCWGIKNAKRQCRAGATGGLPAVFVTLTQGKTVDSWLVGFAPRGWEMIGRMLFCDITSGKPPVAPGAGLTSRTCGAKPAMLISGPCHSDRRRSG